MARFLIPIDEAYDGCYQCGTPDADAYWVFDEDKQESVWAVCKECFA